LEALAVSKREGILEEADKILEKDNGKKLGESKEASKKI